MSLPSALLLALFNHRHHVFAEDLVYDLRDDHPHLTCGQVDETMRRFKVAGLVDEQKSPVNFDAQWKLRDEAVRDATLAGLRVLALNATNGEV